VFMVLIPLRFDYNIFLILKWAIPSGFQFH